MASMSLNRLYDYDKLRKLRTHARLSESRLAAHLLKVGAGDAGHRVRLVLLHLVRLVRLPLLPLDVLLDVLPAMGKQMSVNPSSPLRELFLNDMLIPGLSFHGSAVMESE